MPRYDYDSEPKWMLIYSRNVESDQDPRLGSNSWVEKMNKINEAEA